MTQSLPLYLDYDFWSKFLNDNKTSPESMMEMLQVGYNKINWSGLSANSADGALMFLESNIDKVYWPSLSGNPNAKTEKLLRANPSQVDTDALAVNVGKWSWNLLRELAWRRCMVFKEDLVKNRFHPDNMSKMEDWGFWGHEEDEYELPY